jgi:hypothetical protein
MLGSIGRLVAALLFAWFAFVLAAMGLAYVKKRNVVPKVRDAEEVDLVAAFGALDF